MSSLQRNAVNALPLLGAVDAGDWLTISRDNQWFRLRAGDLPPGDTVLDRDGVPISVVDYLLAQPATPLDFGAVGDGVTDDSDELEELFYYAGQNGGGPVSLRKRYFINRSVAVADYVQIEGMGQGARYANRTGATYRQRSGLIVFGASGGLSMGEGSGIRRMMLVRDICAANPTSEANCLSTIAAFAGDAITINGKTDVTVDEVLAVGFNRFVVGAAADRARIVNNKSHCRTDIELFNIADTPHIEGNHLWPFWSTNRAGYSSEVNVMPGGRGIYLHDRCDGPIVTNNLTYGKAVGIDLFDVYAAKVHNNWIDNAYDRQGSLHAVGIRTLGDTRLASVMGNHVDSHEVNYDFAHNAGASGMVAIGNTSGSATVNQVRLGTGGGTLVGSVLAGNASVGVQFVTNYGAWDLDHTTFEDSTTATLFATPGALSRRATLRMGKVNLRNTAAGFDPRAWVSYVEAGSTADQALSTTPVRILYNNKLIDALGEFVGNTQFLCAATGEYRFEIGYAVQSAIGTANPLRVLVYLNGALDRALVQQTVATTQVQIGRVEYARFLPLGTAVEVYVQMDGGGTIKAAAETSFKAIRVGASL